MQQNLYIRLMEHHQPHISIYINEFGYTIISMDDYELFDTIEDYLNEECDFNFEYVNIDEENKKYEINLEKNYSFEEVRDVILKLDKEEIERIYRVNNPV